MPIIENSTYQPQRFFRNANLNTLYPALLRSTKGVDFQRFRQELPDGDFIDLDWSFQKKQTQTNRLVICMHGLEGNAQRPYMAQIMRRFNAEGVDAVGVNYRGCSGESNRFLRGYHSGWTTDLDFLVNKFDSEGKYTDITIVGFSVGGNITLKYGGEKGDKMPPSVKRLITFCAPCNLATCSIELAKPHNRFYIWQFLFTLKQKAKEKNKIFPKQINLDKVLKANDFGEFDDAFTAPINGFLNAEDYWEKASSLPFIPQIKIPALLISALDDSFLAADCYPYEAAKNSPHFFLETPQYGGHLGFMSPDKNGFLWTENRAWDFVKATDV